MDSSLNLELVLVIGTLITGVIVALYSLYLRITKKTKDKASEPMLVDYAKSFFPILLIVLVVRSFIAEPFRIPSGSMIPTLEIGDFILVKKYSYGIRLPVLHTKVLEMDKPKRGDVIVFRYPPKPEINYIKRLIGLPGDHIKWTSDKKLFINNEQVKLDNSEVYKTKNDTGMPSTVRKYKETLPNGITHDLIYYPSYAQAGEWDVPQGHYFMMGDNRDNSSDSRFWGFVPEENLVGKASIVWMHWNWLEGGGGFKADRIGAAAH